MRGERWIVSEQHSDQRIPSFVLGSAFNCMLFGGFLLAALNICSEITIAPCFFQTAVWFGLRPICPYKSLELAMRA